MRTERWAGRRIVGTLLPLAVVFGACGEAPPPEPRVLLIGIDGVRPDVMAAVETPSLDALARAGDLVDDAVTGVPSLSGPSWTSMLTGVWKEKHGILSNDFPFPRNALDSFPDFLTRVERLRPEMTTFAVVDWRPLGSPAAGGPVISHEIDFMWILDGYELGWAEADRRSVRRAVQAIREDGPHAAFVYLGNPDEVSHESGGIGVPYRAAIQQADRHVGRLVDAIRRRPEIEGEDWLVLVSTDHGRRADGGHGGDSPEELTIFIIAARLGARADAPLTLPDGAAIVDLAPTALDHLGIPIDPAWALDGRSLLSDETPD